MSNSQKKIITVDGQFRVKFNTSTGQASVLTQSYFPGIVTGGWGDPHLWIRLKGSNAYLSRWGDNRIGTFGKNEILYLYIKTTRDTIAIYYSNKDYLPNDNGKIINTIRVVYNGVSTTYTNNAYKIFGPVRLSIVRVAYSSSYYLNFEIDWDPIYNIRQIAGGFGLAMRRVLANNGNYLDGKDGARWDGFGFLGQPYSITRLSLQSGVSSQQFNIQSDEPVVADMGVEINNLIIGNKPTSLAEMPTGIGDTFLTPPDLTDGIVDEDTGASATVFDGTTAPTQEAYVNKGGIIQQLADLVVNDGTSVDGLETNVAGVINDQPVGVDVTIADPSVSPSIDNNYLYYLLNYQKLGHYIP